MKDTNREELTPEFELPTEQEMRRANPYASQEAYIKYWEARELERRREAMRNSKGLSVYERARGY